MHNILENEKVEKMKQEERAEKERLKEKEEERIKADIKKNIVQKIQALKYFKLGSVWINFMKMNIRKKKKKCKKNLIK